MRRRFCAGERSRHLMRADAETPLDEICFTPKMRQDHRIAATLRTLCILKPDKSLV
jgi:hypothetical protein